MIRMSGDLIDRIPCDMSRNLIRQGFVKDYSGMASLLNIEGASAGVNFAEKERDFLNKIAIITGIGISLIIAVIVIKKR